MYYYIYDSFVADKKYETLTHKIEARLMDLGINGRSEKLTILKSYKEIVNDAIAKGAQTIVAVGNDETVSKIIGSLSNYSITIGIIPIGQTNSIASMLGIPQGEAACNVLSSRIVEKIDLGKANNSYFISSLDVPAQPSIVMDYGSYSVSPLSEKNVITIRNFNTDDVRGSDSEHTSNPKDGIFETVISGPKKKSGILGLFQQEYGKGSVFPFKKLKIKCASDCLPIIADGQTTIKTPVTVEVLPKKLNIIVGKNRMF